MNLKGISLFLVLLGISLLHVPAFAGNGAWLTYWDLEGALAEAAAHTEQMDELICFEVYFEESGGFVIPEETLSMLDALRDSSASVYVSLVNDVQHSDGSVTQKSKDFLRENLRNHETIGEHLSRILRLVDEYNLTGIEIDYENFKKDTELWSGFTAFLGRLYTILHRDGIRLRVVMECGAPKYAFFPEGPEYICMCYNLYGYHSGPGPKADLEFLEQVGNDWLTIPGEPRMAFATGGFLWLPGDGGIRALRESDAVELLKESGISPIRDSGSQAMTADIPGDEGGTLWYADGTTLCAWRDVLAKMGYRHFDLFRLSGNEPDSLTLFYSTPEPEPQPEQNSETELGEPI